MINLYSSHTVRGRTTRNTYITLTSDVATTVNISVDHSGLKLSTYKVDFTTSGEVFIGVRIIDYGKIYTVQAEDGLGNVKNIQITTEESIKEYIAVADIVKNIQSAIEGIKPTIDERNTFRMVKNFLTNTSNVNKGSNRTFSIEVESVQNSDIWGASQAQLGIGIVYVDNTLNYDFSPISLALLKYPYDEGILGISVETMERQATDLGFDLLYISLSVDYYSFIE